MPSLLTYDPIGTLKPVGEAIWIADGPLVRFHYLGMHLPFTTRMTLVRLRDGALWVHSPIALTPRLRLEVEALGPVRYLIAPNTFHYAFLIAWLTAYPDALSLARQAFRNARGTTAWRCTSTAHSAPRRIPLGQKRSNSCSSWAR